MVRRRRRRPRLADDGGPDDTEPDAPPPRRHPPGRRPPRRRRTRPQGAQPTNREARDRRAALRIRRGRRIRVAREIHRRASGRARRRDGVHDLRARLRVVAQSTTQPALTSSTASRSSAFRWRSERDPRDFARRSAFVFEHQHSVHDELAWLDAQGPVVPRRWSTRLVPDSGRLRLRGGLQPPLLHGLPRGPAGAAPDRARPDHRARPGAGPGDLRTGAAMPPGRSCTTRPRSARSSNTSLTPREVPGVTVGVGSRRPGATRTRRGRAARSDSTGRSSSTSAAST